MTRRGQLTTAAVSKDAIWHQGDTLPYLHFPYSNNEEDTAIKNSKQQIKYNSTSHYNE